MEKNSKKKKKIDMLVHLEGKKSNWFSTKRINHVQMLLLWQEELEYNSNSRYTIGSLMF